jgi:ATP-dependent DNA helicase RecG
VRLSGKVKWFGRTLQFANPKIESASAEAVHTGRIVPVYALTEGLKEGHLRRWLHTAVFGGAKRTAVVREVPERLPDDLRERRGLRPIAEALREVHFPSSWPDLFAARRRLAFDELLTLQLGLAQRRARWQKDAKAPKLVASDADVGRWIAALPFTLTAGQQQAFAEIRADIGRTIPMSRLLEGDVGSGKTVVAALAARIAIASGTQVALMAPTELLAEQHFRTLSMLFAEGGPSVRLLTSSVGAADRRAILAQLADGTLDVVVGTHALVVEGVAFKKLGLAVVDEQHRFGVRQRTTLREKGVDPHLLLTTATPIPRTLALTLYGDLSVTEIAKPPASRRPIITSWVTAERSSEAYQRLRKHLDAGRQAYVVCPLIEESGTSVARAAEVEAERLRRGELRGYRVGLMHGRLRPAERRALMAAFVARELDVLVATTVIEVGVDVPNATIMIVQEADRFGLAQLHQLRGRVGRGAEQSYCLLISRAREELTDNAHARLQALVDSTDGFELAEKDLELRGEGQLLGTRQSGLSDLRFVHWRRDRPLLERARKAAEALVDYEGPLIEEVERMFGENEVAA